MRARTVSCTRRAGLDIGILRVDRAQDASDQRNTGNVVERKKIGAKAVIDVVGIIRDVVRQCRNLRFRTGISPQFQILNLRIGNDRCRRTEPGIATNGYSFAINDRPIVLDQTFKRFPTQIEAVERRVSSLKIGHKTKRLCVVIEATEISQMVVECAFAGMAEWGMAEIVSQGECLAEIFIEAERARQRAGDLRHFERMRQPRPVMVALVIDEHLRLVGQPAECRGVDDPVAIAAEGISRRARRLNMAAATALRRIGGINCPFAPRFDRHWHFLSFAHDLCRKPVPTFRDHAPH